VGTVAGMMVSSVGKDVEWVAASVGAVAGIVVVGWVDAGLPQHAVRRKANRRKERIFFMSDHLSLIISLILRYVYFYYTSFQLFTLHYCLLLPKKRLCSADGGVTFSLCESDISS
jgi:hypothetical protein